MSWEQGLYTELGEVSQVSYSDFKSLVISAVVTDNFYYEVNCIIGMMQSDLGAVSFEIVHAWFSTP
jgi:hypothetical protein